MKNLFSCGALCFLMACHSGEKTMLENNLWREVLASNSANGEERALEKFAAQLRAEGKSWAISLETLDGKPVALADWDKVPAGQLKILLTVQQQQLSWQPKENKNLVILLRE